MKLDLSGLKPMNEDEKVPCGIDGLMIDMGESKEFVMELWAKSDSFFDGYHAKKKEEIVRCKDCVYYNGEDRYCDIDVFAKPNGYCFRGKKKDE